MDNNGAAVVQVGQSGENLKSKTILKILLQVLYVPKLIEATYMPTKKRYLMEHKVFLGRNLNNDKYLCHRFSKHRLGIEW